MYRGEDYGNYECYVYYIALCSNWIFSRCRDMHSQKNVEGLYTIGIISTYDASLESTLNRGKDVATSYVNKNSVQE